MNAGWYLDPTTVGSGRLRWWDGSAWTAHTHWQPPTYSGPPADAQGPPRYTDTTAPTSHHTNAKTMPVGRETTGPPRYTPTADTGGYGANNGHGASGGYVYAQNQVGVHSGPPPGFGGWAVTVEPTMPVAKKRVGRILALGVFGLLAVLVGLGSLAMVVQPPTNAARARMPQTTYVEPDIAAAVASVETFWEANYQQVTGGDYQPLGDGYVYRSDDAGRPGWCGEYRVTADDAELNAFYCFGDDYIMYDPELIEYLARDIGALAPSIVIAHEWGHRIQAISNTLPNRGLMAELQADCYAGAWVDHAITSGDVALGDTPLHTAALAALLVADTNSYSSNVDEAHGTGFDRIRAMQHGLDNGAGSCSLYQTDPGGIIQGTTDGGEGFDDMPFEQLPAIITAVANDTLNTTYNAQDIQAGQCQNESNGQDAWVCSDNKTIGYDEQRLRELYDEIGDTAVMVPLFKAHLERDNITDTTQQDCYVGAALGRQYQRFISVPDVGDITLAGKDLDEALEYFMLETYDDTIFNRLGALRVGFEQGPSNC